MQPAFGTALKDWRSQRRLSQLELGLAANVSARHISFLETGRARPSRAMVLQLCEELEVPRAARNALLNAAGFSPAYRARELDDEEMAHVRAAMDWTLERHSPYPAFALDRHWTIVKANASASLMLAQSGLAEGDNLLSALADPAALAAQLENWDEVARHMVARLRTESAHLGGDPVLDAAAEGLAAKLDGRRSEPGRILPAVIPARYRVGDTVLSFFSTLAQFGSAEDIALAEIRLEMMFPADDATRQALNAMAGAV